MAYVRDVYGYTSLLSYMTFISCGCSAAVEQSITDVVDSHSDCLCVCRCVCV